MTAPRPRIPRAALSAIVLAAGLAAGCGDDDARTELDVGFDAADATRDVPDAAPDTALEDSGGASDALGDGDSSPEPDPLPADVLAAIDADLERSNATAVSIAIWDGTNDEVRWLGGFGALPDTGEAPNAETLFMLGSDTKKLTAISLLHHVADGSLALDATVAELLDLPMVLAVGFPMTTVEQLLSHQSGVIDMVEWTSTTTDAALARFAGGAFARTAYDLAPPGAMWNYSNPNFSIAGLIDQQLTDTPWADVLRARVVEPLQMTRTFARKSEVDGNVALGVGYVDDEDTTLDTVSLADTWESAFTRPAGLVWTTPSDQARVARFLVRGDETVLPDALVETLHEAHVHVAPDLPGDYGFGLFVMPTLDLPGGRYETPAWIHGGNTLTHTSLFVVLPDAELGVSILSNGVGDNFAATLESLVVALRPELDAPSPLPEPEVDVDALPALAGTYVDPANVGDIIVSVEGGVLTVSIPLLDRYDIPYEPTLTPRSTRVWLVTVDGDVLDLAFIDGPDGVTYLRNRAFVATREAAKSDAPGAAVPAFAPPAAHTLRSLLHRSALSPLGFVW